MLRLIQMIRSDHTLYPRYQNSSKLIKVVNGFAQPDCRLPDGWEKRVDPKSKKVWPGGGEGRGKWAVPVGRI